jgi:hypothetical protein
MISLHHVTADDADRDAHRNLLLMAREHERNATALAEQVNRLTLSLTIRDNDNLTLRRENDALRARVAHLTRKQPRWWEWALAWLLCLWAAYARAWRRWPYALAYLTTAALVVAAIAAARWIGGL